MLLLTIYSNDSSKQSKVSSSNFYENALDKEIEDFKAKSNKVNPTPKINQSVRLK